MNQEQSDGKTRKDWEEFEDIVFKVLQEIFGIEEGSHAVLTRSSKDGGYDGVFWLPLSSDGNDFVQILFEAKLRSISKKTLPLQDFAKALIIAINRSADGIIIASNLSLSEDTKRKLLEFSCKTGLNVDFLSIRQIMDWIKANPNMSKQYSRKLLEQLKESEILCSIKNADPVTAYIKPKNIICLYSQAQNESRDLIVNLIKDKKAGSIIISGDVGLGKTTFIHSVVQKVVENDSGDTEGFPETFKSGEYDLSLIHTPKVLFTLILQTMWRIPSELIDEMEPDEFDEAIHWAGNEVIPKEVCSVVKSAFNKSPDQYKVKADIFDYYLVDYLRRIYEQIKRRENFIFCFTNMNYASSEMLDFLYQFCTVMGDKCSIILELRTSLYIDSCMTMAKWKEYTQKFTEIPHQIYSYALTERNSPNLYELQRYIKEVIRIDMETEFVERIVKKTGKTLLYINAFTEYLKICQWEQLPKELKYLCIDEIQLESPPHILNMLCGRLCEMSSYYAKLFYLTVVFQGSLPTEVIRKVIKYDEKRIDFLLKETDIYELANQTLKVRHSCYMDELRNLNKIGETMRQNLSEKLINSSFWESYVDENQKEMIYIFLYEQLCLHEKVMTAAYLFSEKMYSSNMYSLSKEYIRLSKEASEFILNQDDQFRWSKIQILILYLQNEIHSQTDSNENLQICIDETEKLFQNAHIRERDEYAEKYLEFLLARNRVYHYQGQYAMTLKNMKDALCFLDENACKVSDTLKAKCWKEYAIAVKEMYSIDECLKTFRLARKACPADAELLVSNMTHLSEKYSTYNPRIAMKYLRMISNHETEIPLSSVYHNRNDIIAMNLYLGEYDEGIRLGEEILFDVKKYGLRNEESRCSNLMGCLHMVKGDDVDAKHFFKHGIDLLDSNRQIITLWPLLANQATLFIHMGKWQEAYERTILCMEILIQHYQNRVNHSNFKGRKFPKIFTGILLIYSNLRTVQDRLSSTPENEVSSQIERLRSIFHSEQFLYYYAEMDSGVPFTQIIKGTPFLQNGFCVIKT